jgi:hypothetical protein
MAVECTKMAVKARSAGYEPTPDFTLLHNMLIATKLAAFPRYSVHHHSRKGGHNVSVKVIVAALGEIDIHVAVSHRKTITIPAYNRAMKLFLTYCVRVSPRRVKYVNPSSVHHGITFNYAGDV